MAHIQISYAHPWGETEARRRAEALVQDLAERLDAKYHWQGNTLYFERRGAKGSVEIQPHQLLIAIDLGLALRPLRKQIEARIHEDLAKLGD